MLCLAVCLLSLSRPDRWGCRCTTAAQGVANVGIGHRPPTNHSRTLCTALPWPHGPPTCAASLLVQRQHRQLCSTQVRLGLPVSERRRHVVSVKSPRISSRLGGRRFRLCFSSRRPCGSICFCPAQAKALPTLVQRQCQRGLHAALVLAQSFSFVPHGLHDLQALVAGVQRLCQPLLH